jgi:hypothetical protein
MPRDLAAKLARETLAILEQRYDAPRGHRVEPLPSSSEPGTSAGSTIDTTPTASRRVARGDARFMRLCLTAARRGRNTTVGKASGTCKTV